MFNWILGAYCFIAVLCEGAWTATKWVVKHVTPAPVR